MLSTGIGGLRWRDRRGSARPWQYDEHQASMTISSRARASVERCWSERRWCSSMLVRYSPLAPFPTSRRELHRPTGLAAQAVSGADDGEREHDPPQVAAHRGHERIDDRGQPPASGTNTTAACTSSGCAGMPMNSSNTVVASFGRRRGRRDSWLGYASAVVRRCAHDAGRGFHGSLAQSISVQADG